MKAETKFRYKKKSKLYSIIAWITIGIFVLALVSSLLFSKSLPTTIIMTIFWSAFVFIVTGLIFNFISDMYRRRLVEYMKNIREYRTLRDYQKALMYIDSDDIKSAINLYNNCIPNGRYKDLLYISLIHEFKHSDDEIMKEKGCRKFAEVIMKNDPNNIYLFNDI